MIKSSLTPTKKTVTILIILLLVIPLNDKLIVNTLIFKDFDLIIDLNQANIFYYILYLFFLIL